MKSCKPSRDRMTYDKSFVVLLETCISKSFYKKCSKLNRIENYNELYICSAYKSSAKMTVCEGYDMGKKLLPARKYLSYRSR